MLRTICNILYSFAAVMALVVGAGAMCTLQIVCTNQFVDVAGAQSPDAALQARVVDDVNPPAQVEAVPETRPGTVDSVAPPAQAAADPGDSVGETQTLDRSAESQLKLADIYLGAGEWDGAIEAYRKAAESNFEVIAGKAREGLARALRAREASPLGLRAQLPAPLNRWRLIDYAVYAMAVFVLAPLLLAFAFRVLGPFFRLILKKRSASADWRVSISGTAKEPFRSMAFDEFVVTMRELHDNDHATREFMSIGKPGGRLFTPISLIDLVGPKLTVRGIDLSQLAKALQLALDYFSYRLEVRIDENGDSAYICAYLRWGGLTERAWQIPSINDPAKLQYREIGRQLAFNVFGDGLVRQ